MKKINYDKFLYQRIKYTDQAIVDILVVNHPRILRAVIKTLEEIDEIEKFVKER